MGIFNQLKQRRLVQVVFSYLAAGWVFLEVVDQFTDRNVLPEPVYYIGLVWFLTGIPAAFLVGWHHGEKGRQKAPRSEVAILSMLAVGALLMSGFTVAQLTAPEVDLADFGLDPNRVAVLYFEDLTPGGHNQHIANGLTEILIEQLSESAALDVVSANGVRSFQGQTLPRDSISQILAAGTLVGGTLESAGDLIRVEVQLYDGFSGSPLPDGRVSLEPRSPDSLMAVMADLGEQAAQLLRRKLGQHVQVARRGTQTNLTAWTLVQRGEKLRRDADALAHHDLEAAFARFDEAHQILVQAQRADTLWARPTVLRSEIEYRKSRLSDAHLLEAERHLDRSLELADEALSIDPADPEALSSRGTVRLRKYVLNLVHDSQEKDRLLELARSDLERAVRLDPELAHAHNMLSVLYFVTDNMTRGVLAAQRAYDADAYLEAADDVLFRLYSGNYSLENWTEARKWCEIALRRFPRDPGFMNCPLNLMVAGAMEPDPDRAWAIAGEIAASALPQMRDYERILATLNVGGVLARAGLQDSARAVLDRTAAQIHGDVDVGNDLRWAEAHMRVIAGQEDAAIDRLAHLIAADPHHAFGSGAQIGWEWRPLLNHPRFAELQRASAADH